MSSSDKTLSDTDLEIAEITESAASMNFNDRGLPQCVNEPIVRINRGRGRGQWSAKIREREQQEQSLGNGCSSHNVNTNSHNVNTNSHHSNKSSDQPYYAQQIPRNRYSQFEDDLQKNDISTTTRQENDTNGHPQQIRRSREFHEKNNTYQDDEERNHTQETKEKEVYVPDKLNGDALFEDRKSKPYRTGLNFDAYENIPCEVTGDRARRFNIQSFEDLGLKSEILKNIKKMGYVKPTPIQKYGTPHLMQKIDIMACAQTGSGKTAGFLLPIINALLDDDDLRTQQSRGRTPAFPLCLILTPTRELCSQIYTEANMYANDTCIINCCVYGGVALFHQRQSLRHGCHMLIATPGRLIQFMEENCISLEKLKYFVLDEADRMLDMGFMAEVRKIVKQLPPKEQRISAMFSATFPRAIQNAASEYLQQYVFVTIGTVGGACYDIQQIICRVERADKRRKLREIFQDVSTKDKVLIFCGKKQSCDFLAAHLATSQISSTSIHGDRLQSQRELALKEFTEGTRQVLVATSVASRGLDIPKVAVVINYDLPDNIEEYVHRIGRTGRVGHVGKAISFYDTSSDAALASPLIRILRNANQEVPDWLLKHSEPDENRFGNDRRFGATDYRMKKGSFTGFKSVPDAIEVDDDDWGQ